MRKGIDHFLPSVVCWPMMQHEQRFKNMQLAGFVSKEVLEIKFIQIRHIVYYALKVTKMLTPW